MVSTALIFWQQRVEIKAVALLIFPSVLLFFNAMFRMQYNWVQSESASVVNLNVFILNNTFSLLLKNININNNNKGQPRKQEKARKY